MQQPKPTHFYEYPWKLGLYEFAHAGVTGTSRAWYRNAKLYSTGHTARDVLGISPGPMYDSYVRLRR